MKKFLMTALSIFALACCNVALAEVHNFRFGILKQLPDGSYEMDIETKIVPLHPKETGFRFGIAFDNTDNKYIEWYVVVHLPKVPKKISGGFQKAAKSILKGDLQPTTDSHVVDQFWFDERDPLGMYRLAVYVNETKIFQVDFEVVRPASMQIGM